MALATITDIKVNSTSIGFVAGTTTGYTVTIPNNSTSVTVNTTYGTGSGTLITIIGGGITTNVATASPNTTTISNLIVGSNIITVQGLTYTYSITIIREPSLINLTITSGSLPFSWNMYAYSISVGNDISLVSITPVTTNGSTIKVNGTTFASGAPVQVELIVGNTNVITISVTSSDGTISKTYTLTITRAASPISTLSALTAFTSAGDALTLSPTFSSGVLSYTSIVANAVSVIKITPTVSESTATVKVNGVIVNSGSTSEDILLLTPGRDVVNIITIIVTAGDGIITSTYIIAVTRTPLTISTLGSLSLSSGPLSPIFSSGVLSYTSSVVNSIENITVTPTVTTNSDAKIKVNSLDVISGNASTLIFLAENEPTPITIVVTAQDGITITTYTIAITRGLPSKVTSLSSLESITGELVPAFSPKVFEYKIDVTYDTESFALTPKATNQYAHIDVEGVDVVSGALSQDIPLKDGKNLIIIQVTAEDPTIFTEYKLNVVKEVMYDSSTTTADKAQTLGLPGADSSILANFDIPQLAMVSQIQNLSDCAKNLPHRLMEMAQAKVLDMIMSTPLAKDLTSKLDALAKQGEAINKITELANPKKLKEETLKDALLAAKKLTGFDLVQKVNDVVTKFGDVSGIADMLNGLSSLNICQMDNFAPGGAPIPNPTNIPLDTPPPAVEGVAAPVANAGYDSKPKDEYDSFIFQLKEHLVKDPAKVSALTGSAIENYTRMLSVINTITYAYHDNISRTTDNSKDEQYKQAFLGLVESELSKHPEWDGALQSDYKGRCGVIENEITRNTNVIRAFYSRNAAATGDWIPMFMTAYGAASIDKTTADDQAKADRGIKGYEGFSQSQGAHGTLVQGTSVASNYWKGKTVLEIRYAKDQTPVGGGRVTVHDTGGMSTNVIDYYCGNDKELYKAIASKGTNNGGKTKPTYAVPIEVRLVSGAPRQGKTL